MTPAGWTIPLRCGGRKARSTLLAAHGGIRQRLKVGAGTAAAQAVTAIFVTRTSARSPNCYYQSILRMVQRLGLAGSVRKRRSMIVLGAARTKARTRAPAAPGTRPQAVTEDRVLGQTAIAYCEIKSYNAKHLPWAKS